jgi:hypothetical protein
MTIRALHGGDHGGDGATHGADLGGDRATHGADHGAENPEAAPADRAAPSPLAEQGGNGAQARARPADPRAILRTAHGAQHGARQDRFRAQSHGEKADPEYVVYRLEEAGATLLALPGTGWSPRLRTSQLEIVRTALEAYGWEPPRARPPVPSSGRITRMDEALAWVTLIPRDRYVLRRIVGARALVSPLTERHLFSWRRLGVLLGADHKAIQRWHGEGIRIIVAALNAPAEKR